MMLFARLQNSFHQKKRDTYTLNWKCSQRECAFLIGKIQDKTGCRLSCMTANACWQRGAGRVCIERIEYPLEMAFRQLASVIKYHFIWNQGASGFFLLIQISLIAYSQQLQGLRTGKNWR